jgi:hypothetical protein
VHNYTDQVLQFAKELEGQIPLQQIASTTKHEFSQKCSPATVSNILKSNPEYFNKNKARKTHKTQSLKSRLLSKIKNLPNDDPTLEAIVSEFAEPLHLVR